MILLFLFYVQGCKLKNSRVDRCMTKEQVAFKFHECPDGDDIDSRGNVVILINNHVINH